MRFAPKTALAATVALALLAYAGVLARLVRIHEGDVSRMVVAGGAGVDASRVPPGLTVKPQIAGYDGMFFYRLALDPFTREETAYGITLDQPPFRHQRIMYPLLIRAASLGRAEWMPVTMVALNLVAIALIALAAGALAMHYGRSALWGIVVPLYPGFIISLSRDTAEIVAWMFGTAAMWAYAKSRWKLCTLLLCCALLTRETTLILAIAIAAVWVWRRSASVPWFTFATPLALYGVGQLALRAWWGHAPLQVGAPDPQVPFSGYLHVFAASLVRRSVQDRLQFAECIFLALLVGAVVLTWRRSAAHAEWRVAWLGALAIAALLGRDIWYEHFGYMRAVAELCVLSLVLMLGAGPRVRWFTAVITVALWLQLARHI